ncbi:hypothetical protein [Leptodesmis sichuanensis]|uniref:hypothetical protein n=1 Tax=Leptodesmis sichuanensis TaxID=2906798 RepID=UPI001F2A6F7D|nr:hypothetical protein [Leptodesmis sichuanensis]UIE39480.1 hypothetical protein KIK02_07950 [Leptodesmis sichuanensis A121]
MSPLEHSTTVIDCDRSDSAVLASAKSLQSLLQCSAKLSHAIACSMSGVVSAVVLFSASSALALPTEASIYGKGMVLQTPDHVVLPDGIKFSNSQFSMGSDRFIGIETLDPAKVTITSWKTELPVTMPNGQAAVATFYGSPEHPMATPGAAVQRGFTLPEERITFSTNSEFLRTSGLNGIGQGEAFTGPDQGSKMNPTEFGTAYTRGGMTTSANWMVVRDREGKVLFAGTPATYAAQLYWNGKAAALSDAEGLSIGEGNYQKSNDYANETTHETAWDHRLRHEVVETEHSVQGRKTWDVTETQQRLELSKITQPFQAQETTQAKQNFNSDLASIFPLQTVSILQRDLKIPHKFNFKTNFQLAGDVSNDSNPTLSGQLRIPLDSQKGTSSLSVVVGGAPRNHQPGQPDFYALLYTQFNTPLLRVENGQYQPNPFAAGIRLGGGVFHAPVASRLITQTVTKSGVDIISERRVFNDFTTTTWGQDFTTHFTQRVANDYVDTYRIDTTHTTPMTREITDVVVTRTDGSTFTAPDYRTVTVQRGQTISDRAAALTNSELVASSTSIQPGQTEVSNAFVLNQQTTSQLVEASTASQRIVQDVSVKQTVSDQAGWGDILFINPYFGNFDLASVSKPGSLLYEIGGTFVRSSLLGNVNYKDSNVYLNVGMPVWNPGMSGKQDAGTGLLTLRAHATYLPVNHDLRVGVGLQLSGF